MSVNKKYYYLKLKDNFFDSEEIKIIESMIDGYKYSNILLRLYLKSLKSDGVLMFRDGIPYNSQMLSTILGHSIGDIEKAVKIFIDFKIIEKLENGAIFMNDIQLLVGKSSTEGERKKKARLEVDKQALLEGGGQTADICPPEKEKEKELELELELEHKEKLSKFNLFINELKNKFEENKLLTFVSKINTTLKSKEAFKNVVSMSPDNIIEDYVFYVARNRKLSARLDKYLVAYREGNLQDIEYAKDTRDKTQQTVDNYFADKEVAITDAEVMS